MKINNYSNDTRVKLLSVSKKMLSMLELADSEVIWFTPVGDDLTSADYNLVINKLHNLWILDILDETHAGPPIPYPLSHKLKVSTKHLRKFINELEKKDSDTQYIKVSWPTSYRWDENGYRFLVGDGKEFIFQSKDSDRRNVFDCLVKRKGDWVRVDTISEELKIKDKRKVRIIINQISDRIKKNELNKYLKIESSNHENIQGYGAYRILPA